MASSAGRTTWLKRILCSYWLLQQARWRLRRPNMILKWPDGTLLNFFFCHLRIMLNHWRFKNCPFFFFGQYRKNPLLNRLIDIVLMGVIHLCIVSLYNYAEKKTVIQYWPSSWSTWACSFHSSIVSKCPAFAHKKTFLEYTHDRLMMLMCFCLVYTLVYTEIIPDQLFVSTRKTVRCSVNTSSHCHKESQENSISDDPLSRSARLSA